VDSTLLRCSKYVSSRTASTPSSSSSTSCLPASLRLTNLDCTTQEQFLIWSKVPELASLEMAFDLYVNKDLVLSAVKEQMNWCQVNLPISFDVNQLPVLSKHNVKNAILNIARAREKLISCMEGIFSPGDDQLLHDWYSDGMRYTKGCRVQAENFVLNIGNRHMMLSLSTGWILRHIMFSHNLTLVNTLCLWASFHVLIMHCPLDLSHFPSQSMLWNHNFRLDYIDNQIATDKFQAFITKRSPHGFRRYYFSSSDDSEHHKRNRHVVLLSHNNGKDINDIQPSFRHVTSSISAVKSTIQIKMLMQ